MKRFYRDVEAAQVDGGWQVRLDGRGVKTPGGRSQLVPNEPLAQLLAAEWTAQGEVIDPRQFPARDLADYAIDAVAHDRSTIVAELLRYAETDTLCYRADPGEPLWQRQCDVWDPLLDALETREGISLRRISGVIHQPQGTATLARLRERLERFDPFTLAALQLLTTLPASLAVGLAALEPDADGPALWDAANLEEQWQAEQWGRDAEAEARLAARRRDFLAALRFARAARG